MESFEELPESLADVDRSFKISAGPGAGKTTWLVRHVQNVLQNSNKLNRVQKIACITYTRIGADTVKKKVKSLSGTSRVEIGTIHNFLYQNVIKPFSYLIKSDENGEDLFDISALSGHIENRPNYDRVCSWATSIGPTFKYLHDNTKKDKNGFTNYFKTVELLKKIEWSFNGGVISCNLRNNYFSDYAFPSSPSNLFKYKLANWRKGIMHHEDVLYFAYVILNKNRRIAEFLSNKFPYLLLDEFQDTTPLQSWIIKEIAQKGTIVGVIGDSAQAIYKFAGAKRQDFINFPNLLLFKKSNNFRSTQKIINFLKNLRDDIHQQPRRDALNGENVTLLVGQAEEAIAFIKELDEDNYAVLCRYNKDVNRLKRNLHDVTGENLINLLYLEDSSHRRAIFIHSLFKAYDFYESGDYKEAIKELKCHLRTTQLDGIQSRRVVIRILDYLKNNTEASVLQVYKHWQTILTKEYFIQGLVSLGKPKSIHYKVFKDFLPFLSKQTKITSKIRTIHQAKGDEFKNTLVCLFDKKDKNGDLKKSLEKILNDYIFEAKENIKIDSERGEETRIYYVAFSRAQEKLFINVPRLNNDEETEFLKLGVNIIRNIPTPMPHVTLH